MCLNKFCTLHKHTAAAVARVYNRAENDTIYRLHFFGATFLDFGAFWCKCYTILNHAGLYEYKHGKMLMHLNFCCEGLPASSSPAAMLRYFRLRKGFTTRQLAERIGIFPTTVLLYEREQYPIPYQTAAAIAETLEVDKHLLFDDFARFMDHPYTYRLHKIRKKHGLN